MSLGSRPSISRLPPLNALRTFVVAARHLNFSRAAEELHVTPAAVGQQIRLLEDHLGVPLFRRLGRRLLLTDEGQACLPGLAEAFDRMRDALADIGRVGAAGPLTVSVAPSFAAKWLVPRLEDFRAKNPDIDVRVGASMQLVAFGMDDVDCAIRYGSGSYPGLFSEKVLGEAVAPVCSPALLASASLHAPEDLARVSLLHDDSPDQDPSCPTWPMWLRAAGALQVDAARGPRFNQSSLVIEAAAGEQGVGLAKLQLAEDDLRAGRLVRPFGATLPLQFGYHLVFPERNAALPKVDAFRRWLRAQVSEAEAGGAALAA